MALTWKLTNVADYETKCWVEDPEGQGRRLNPVTEALVWATLSVGIGAITKENVSEFHSRVAFAEKIFGPMLRRADGPEGLTYQDILDHVGLTTNVTKETKAKWTQRVFDAFDRAETYKRSSAQRGKAQ